MVCDDVDVVGINRHRSAEGAGHLTAFAEGIDRNDQARPSECAPNVAHSPIGPCAKIGDAVAGADVAAFGARYARRRDIGKHQHLLVAEFIGDERQVRAASGTSRYSAQAPLMVFPNRQPPRAP